MGKDKPPRHVALAVIFDPESHKILMITSRKHPQLWICKRVFRPSSFESSLTVQYRKEVSKTAKRLVKRPYGRRMKKV